MKPQTDFQVTFDGHAGVRRAGWIRVPHSSAQGWALIAHFFLESTSGPATVLANELAKRGIGSLRVDLGALQPDGPAWEVEDLVKAAVFVERSLGPLRILIGHGIAGAALLAASGAIEGVAGIVTIGAPHTRGERRVVIVPGADHLLSDSPMAAQVSRLIAGWAAEMVSRPSWPTLGASPCAA